MIHPIVKYGQPVLEESAQTITEFDTPELHKLIDDMFESMYAARGVGLAATQIGVGKRVAVIDVSTGEDPAAKLVLINPQIVAREGVADQRRRLPESADVSRAGDPGEQGDGAGVRREGHRV